MVVPLLKTALIKNGLPSNSATWFHFSCHICGG